MPLVPLDPLDELGPGPLDPLVPDVPLVPDEPPVGSVGSLVLVGAVGGGPDDCPVPGAPVVVLVDPSDPGVTLLESGSSSQRTTHTVVLDGATAEPLGDGAHRTLTERYVTGLCVTAAAVLAGARDLTADYIKSRTQFGRSLAEFQAVAMQIADVYIASRTVDLAAANALWRVGNGLEAADDLAVAAHWVCAEAPAALRLATCI